MLCNVRTDYFWWRSTSPLGPSGTTLPRASVNDSRQPLITLLVRRAAPRARPDDDAAPLHHRIEDGPALAHPIGANSYAVSPPDHPMLDFGDGRSDRTLESSLELEAPIGAGLALIGGGAVKVRRSNFPDYVPGVFPMTRQYDIDWDYDDVTAFAGLSWARGLL